MLQGKITMDIVWAKVDFHIESRIYKDGQPAAGDKFSIRLNKVMDIWASEAIDSGAMERESVIPKCSMKGVR